MTAPAMTAPDKIHYPRIPDGLGGRAEMVRMTYVLAGKPYVDAFCSLSESDAVVSGKNPFKQFPFIETASGEIVYQTLAMMHHAAHGTPAWPSDPARLTRALTIAMGGYDLYQAFAGFTADDLVGKKKFEERRAPQYMNGLGELYAQLPFAAGDVPCFADCMAREAIDWCARRNAAAKSIFEANAALVSFKKRFDEWPAIRAFLDRQAAARRVDNAV